MRLDPSQLETLVTILEEGTFEAAARRLHLTPSAVSQRVRALEGVAGRVLLRRTTPVTATAAAEPLLRLGRQLRLLEEEARAALPGPAEADEEPGAPVSTVELPVAVNADSLATWFRGVLGEVARWPAAALRLAVEDQAYSHDLLRRGDVLAAVTSEPRPVQGCAVEPLGRLRYRPAAAPALLERHRRGRSVDWAAMPVVVFNEKDHLQDQVLAAHGAGRPPVVHRIPSTADFTAAIRAGLGWGLVLDPHLAEAEEAGELVRLPGSRPLHVPLHWQRWRLDSPVLDRLSEAVRAAARDGLRRG